MSSSRIVRLVIEKAALYAEPKIMAILQEFWKNTSRVIIARTCILEG
jgi:hypothetical protein